LGVAGGPRGSGACGRGECEGGEAVVGGVGGEGSAVSEFERGKGEWADQLESERREVEGREQKRREGKWREVEGREGKGRKRESGSGRGE
jgi:hypothetical protein